MEKINLSSITSDGKPFGFQYYSRAMKCVKDDVEELGALLSYKSISMIEGNKSRALADIELAIESLKELEDAIIRALK